MFRKAIAALLAAALIYAMIAFVLWELDPNAWGFGGRYFFVIFAGFAAAASVAIQDDNL